MGKRKNSLNKEEICEDCCFHCKDGGSLRICDYKDCLKAYHPKCVEKDDSFLESDVPWTCKWHYCFNCRKTPKFHCFCCPTAICGLCLCDFKFAVIREEEGFCNHCLTLVGLIEGMKVPDSDQNIDFDAPETYESFFKHYWLTVKKTEGLTSRHVLHAIEVLNSGTNPKDIFDISKSDDSTEVEDEYEPEASDDHLSNSKRQKKLNRRKRRRENRSASIRRGNSKEKEFSGWASNLLINFLVSIGKDTSKELSQLDVNDIVIQYCNDSKLFDPVKKKKVVCDSTLTSLLGRKSVNKNSIYSLIAPHFKGNLAQSEDENDQSESENELESEGKNENVLITYIRQRRSSSEIKPRENEVIDLGMQQQGCFASMVSQNIKLVYLNRSLVEELLQQPETFNDRVIGSFVRIKSDPYDYMQKNSHMLVKVTGMKETERNGEVTKKDVRLQVSNMPKDISISQLSNDNFSEEECEDLRRRVKDGLFGRISIVEFKKKTQHLHQIITKQWIKNELYRLQKLIDQANEKGWRRQLYAYIERKNLLETPSEQQRLLDELPEIIADKTEVEPTDQQYSRKDEEKTCLPETNSREFSKPSTQDKEGNGIFSRQKDVADFTELEQQHRRYPRKDEVEKTHLPQSNSKAFSKPSTEDSESNDIFSRQKVVADVAEPEQKHQRYPWKDEEEKTRLPQSNSQAFSKPSKEDLEGNGIFSHQKDVADFAEPEQHNQGPESKEQEQQHHIVSSHKSNDVAVHPAEINEPEAPQCKLASGGQPIACIPEAQSNSSQPEKPRSKKSGTELEIIEISDNEQQDSTSKVGKITLVISDDEEQDNSSTASKKMLERVDAKEKDDKAIGGSENIVDDPDACIWYIKNEFGIERGPYSMSLLKEWNNIFPGELAFKVWKANQNPKEAIPIIDAVRQFSNRSREV